MGNLQSPSASALALALPGSSDISHFLSRGIVMPLAGRQKMDALREAKWEQTQFLQLFSKTSGVAASTIQFLNIILKCLYCCLLVLLYLCLRYAWVLLQL